MVAEQVVSNQEGLLLFQPKRVRTYSRCSNLGATHPCARNRSDMTLRLPLFHPFSLSIFDYVILRTRYVVIMCSCILGFPSECNRCTQCTVIVGPSVLAHENIHADECDISVDLQC